MFGIEQAFAATTEETVAAGIIAGSMMTISLVTLVIWVLLIVARWKIFTKAGEAGWKSIIPIYSDYVQWRIGWKKTGLFWGYIALAFIGIIVIFASGAVVAGPNGSMVATGGGNMILVLLGFAAIMVSAIIQLIAIYKLMRSFGHGGGWLVLYILFTVIMLLVLGFGSSQYEGAQD